jgi:extracellular factor (EF) 3-hydroxypalmitic acid methyl ester biosynthesis protein
MHERAVTFARLTRSQFASDAAMFNAVVEGTHRLMRWIETLEARGVERARIQRAIAPAVAAIAGSPFVARLHAWPRGYPGDFKTIEYLCDGINRAKAGTLGFFSESYYLNSAPACQHRNKLQAQAARISALIGRKPDASILVLAAGGRRDLLQALPGLEASRARLVVNDLEPDAVHLCRQRLARLGDRVTLVPGDALAIGRFRALGPFDLIVAGGLFD